jgi:hypothetical protein
MSRLDKYEDFATVRVADDNDTLATAKQHIDDQGTQAFISAHPEFYPCEENAKLLEAWLYMHNDAAFTRLNLELAQRDLGSNLKVRPLEPEVVDKTRGIILTRTDALAEYQAPTEEKEALDKLKDDVHASDATRKARDRRLAQLAGQQRRELAPQNLYR